MRIFLRRVAFLFIAFYCVVIENIFAYSVQWATLYDTPALVQPPIEVLYLEF